MFVYPVRDGVKLPAEWARFAEQPADPYALDPAQVASERDDWLAEWRDLATR
jgi:thiamine transport system substrate-binding protein